VPLTETCFSAQIYKMTHATTDTNDILPQMHGKALYVILVLLTMTKLFALNATVVRRPYHFPLLICGNLTFIRSSFTYKNEMQRCLANYHMSGGTI
jgi:hypothetical protein